uniref:DUF58 domain-containing protein n=1 Tax=Salinadaptatus halalkaliphilus TaxID=2419781 RepID=UPI0037447EC2
MGRQRRFRGAVAATILLVAAGLVDGNGVLLLGAIVPLAYVAYGSLSTATVPDDIVVSRTIVPSPAPPGQPVTVGLTVRNDGDRTLADVRIVDGVPEALAVLEGSPRAGTTLEPGETVHLEYLVVARRGEYEFEDVQIRCRGLAAGAVATARLSPAGDRALHCRLDADAPPLEDRGRGRVGQLTTDRAGEGIAFHSTREYRPDDPADRIDWRQYAKRGTLATVAYERQVAATVVLVVDARAPNRVVAGPGQPTAVELSAYAATRALTDLLGHGHDVGLAVLGVDGDGPAGLAWLAPGQGRDHRSRAFELLRSATEFDEPVDDDGDRRKPQTSSIQAPNWHLGGPRSGNPDESPTGDGRGSPREERGRGPPRGEQPPSTDDESALDSLANGRPLADSERTRSQSRKLIELVDQRSQLALFSPLLDDRALETIETWRAADLPVVALSPDVVPSNTVSGQYEQTRRRTRLARCQRFGARAVDWRRGTPLDLIVAYAFRVEALRSSGRLGAGSGGGT